MKKVSALAGCMALMIGVLTSVGLASVTGSQVAGASSSIQKGGVLTFDRQFDILTLDPTKIADDESAYASENIYQTLYSSSQNGHSLKPLLATSYSVSSNKLEWTFNLRHGVRFSNGKAMTSADVKYSIERVSADSSNPFAFIDSAIAKISTPNAYTVVITTKYPWAPMLSDMALYANAILPNNLNGESASTFFKHPIGTGPFKVKNWAKGSELSLVDNPYYWVKGEPYLAGVNFDAISSDTTRQLQLQSGQAQVDEYPPFPTISSLAKSSGVNVSVTPSSLTEFLLFNNSVKPFNNVHVRRAISFALDRKAMVSAVLYGHGTVANSFLPPVLWAYDKSTPGVQYNLTEAKSEMAKSSVPNGFSTTLNVGSGSTVEQSLGQIIQAELQPLGIKVTLKQVNINSEYTTIEAGNYQMALQATTSDIIDPDEMVTFESMGGKSGQGTKALFTNYNNVNIDKWGTAAEKIFSEKSRKTLYDDIQVQLAKDAPMAFLYYQPQAYAYSNKVHGFNVYLTGNYPLQAVWLSK